MRFPELKTIADGIGGGAVEVLQVGSRLIKHLGATTNQFGANLENIGDSIKSGGPTELPGAALKIASATVSSVLGTVEGVVGVVDTTAKGIKNQLDRIIK